MSNISFFLNISTSNDSKADFDLPPSIYAVLSFTLMVGFLDIFLNAIALCGIMKANDEGNVTLTLLRHNSVMDILSGIIIIYDCIIIIFRFQNSMECGFRYGGMVGVFCAAGILILGVNMERYLKIIFPLRYENYVTPKVVTAYITFVWLVVLGYSISAILKQEIFVTNPDDEIEVCHFFAIFEGALLLVLSIDMFAVFGLQLLMYMHIFCVAISKIKADLRNERSTNGQRLRMFACWWKPYRVLFMIVGVNFLSVSPCGIYFILVQSGSLSHYTVGELGGMVSYTAVPIYLIGIVNPLLYSMQIPEVKHTFLRVFGCCKRNSVASV